MACTGGTLDIYMIHETEVPIKLNANFSTFFPMSKSSTNYCECTSHLLRLSIVTTICEHTQWRRQTLVEQAGYPFDPRRNQGRKRGAFIRLFSFTSYTSRL
jgi:hypothetical protein